MADVHHRDDRDQDLQHAHEILHLLFVALDYLLQPCQPEQLGQPQQAEDLEEFDVAPAAGLVVAAGRLHDLHDVADRHWAAAAAGELQRETERQRDRDRVGRSRQ